MRSDAQRLHPGPRALQPDLPLLLGLVAVIALVLLALYGPILAAHDPFETHLLYHGKVPPFDPSPEFPLGTDALGRDRLSWLLFGARMTFTIALAAAGMRMVAGVFLGLVAAWQGGTAELLLSRTALALVSIPATIATCLAVLAFNVNAGALAFVLALSVTGWADAFQHVRRAGAAEAARPYIESARALGLNEERILVRHLLPNLAPALLTIGSMQISAVLLLLGELALLRLFFGGAVSTDLYGIAIVLPSQPEWSSTLGATRPIYDLYGNAIAVTAPAAGLLFAVISFNLFGDALAQRAQRLDLFHLFSARQWTALGLVCIAVVAPALLWPGRLAHELAYGDGFNAERARAAMHALVASEFADRVAQSAQADAAAEHIAEAMGGITLAVNDSVRRVEAAAFEVGAHRLALGPDLVPLSQTSGSARGELVVTAPLAALTRSSSSALVRGKIALVRDVTPATVGFVARVLSAAAAAAIVVVSDDPLETQDIGTPMLRLAPARLAGLVPGGLPAVDGSSPVTAIATDAAVSLAITVLPVRGRDAVLRIRARDGTDAPLLVAVAPYDQAEYTHYIGARVGWSSASATGVLVAAAARVRSEPIQAQVMFVAAGAQSLDSAGLKAALRSLSEDEKSRVAAVILVQSAQARSTTIRSDPAAAVNPGGGPSIAGRLASATGQRYAAQRTPTLLRAALAAGVRAPTFELASISAEDIEPGADELGVSGRVLLTMLSYLATHTSQLGQ